MQMEMTDERLEELVEAWRRLTDRISMPRLTDGMYVFLSMMAQAHMAMMEQWRNDEDSDDCTISNPCEQHRNLLRDARDPDHLAFMTHEFLVDYNHKAAVAIIHEIVSASGSVKH